MVEVAALAVAVGALGYSAYAGERQASTARKGLRLQEQAQQEAQAAAVSQTRQAEEAENRARQKTPDLNVLLSNQLTSKPGPTSIDANRLLLGRPGLLGF